MIRCCDGMVMMMTNSSYLLTSIPTLVIYGQLANKEIYSRIPKKKVNC